MFTTTASLLTIAVIILMLVIFLLVALRTSRDESEPEPIARYCQNGMIVRGDLRKGAQRIN